MTAPTNTATRLAGAGNTTLTRLDHLLDVGVDLRDVWPAPILDELAAVARSRTSMTATDRAAYANRCTNIVIGLQLGEPVTWDELPDCPTCDTVRWYSWTAAIVTDERTAARFLDAVRVAR